MKLTVKSKILLTVLSVVLMFALFILFYYPAKQQRFRMESYNKEIQNFSSTVALGVKIALTEENYEGVETALDFVRDDKRLQFVSLITIDTVWKKDKINFELKKEIFMTYPDSVLVDTGGISNNDFIIKRSSFETPLMNGEIMLSFSTTEIREALHEIRVASGIASLVVFLVGLFFGFRLAKNISVPVLALRDAANKVGEGDLTQFVSNKSGDEIGELGIAFNKMVKDLGSARKQINQRNVELKKEKQKSDELLLNILPSKTAEEIKKTGKAKAQYYESVTVMFTDFKDFTAITKNMSPDKIVEELHYCFSEFDKIIKKHNIEKIKTIGDSYMCVAGLPVINSTHPFDAVNAAIEIRDMMLQYKKDKEAKGDISFDLRIGIHTGPVVAGIVGINKFAYDIWGSSVNTASRLEGSSKPGKINISKSLYEIIKEKYDCISRGNKTVKGLGKIPMYFLEGLKIKN